MATSPRLAPPTFPGPPPTDPAQRGVLAHQPALLRAFLRCYGTLWSHGVLDAATKEVVRIRNARVTDCRYCRNVRFAAARDDGLDESQVARIDEGFAESSLSERQKTVIRWTDAFLVEPCGRHEELRAALLRQLDAAQVVELTAGLALFMGFSKIAVVLGQEPEDMRTTVIPTPVRPE